MNEAITQIDADQPSEMMASSFPNGGHQQKGALALFRLLWNSRRILAKATFCGFLVALIIAFLIPKTYKSSVQLMPPDSQSSGPLAMIAAISGGNSSLGSAASDLMGLKSTGALFIGVLRSRTVQDDIVNRFDLRKVYNCRYMQDARIKLLDNTNIYDDRKSGIISLEVADRDPKRATAIAEAYVEELNKVVVTQSTSAARKERIFLEERLKAVQEDMGNAERELSQFSSKNATLDIKEQSRTMVQAAATLTGELIAAQSELKGLEAIYTDSNIRVRTLKARIANLQSEIKKIGGNPATSVNETETFEGIPSIRQLPVLGVQFADLYRRVKVQEAVFEALTKQYELAKVQEAKEVPTVKVLDAPDAPERKASPPRLLLAILGATLCFLGTCGWLLLRVGWSRLDEDDERKILITEVYETGKRTVKSLARRFHRRNLDEVTNQ